MLYKTSEENLNRSSNDFNSTNDQENDGQGEIIVSRSSSQAIQHPLPDKREALRLNNLPSSTLCAYVNHKVTLCKPLTRSKAISCAPITFNRATQTLFDDDEEKQQNEQTSNGMSLLPIPVGLVTPLPLALGTTDCPVPVPIPIPVPLPLFFVVNDEKFHHYEEYLTKLKEILPENELDAQLLAFAQSQFPTDDLLGLAKFNPKNVFDEMETESMLNRSSTNGIPSTDEDLGGTEENLFNKLVYEFDSFDLSTIALTGQDLHLTSTTSHPTGNSQDKIEYLMKQDDVKYILKWHFAVKIFRCWIEKKNAQLKLKGNKEFYRVDPLSYRADQLNILFSQFVKDMREVYEGDSIYYLCLGLQHYLRENRPLTNRSSNMPNGHFYRTESMFFDSQFSQFQSKLHSILVRFCQHRDPSRPLSSRSTTTTSTTLDDRPSRIEEELLWEGKQLGAHSPWVLLNTILYFNTKYFFLKTVQEHQVLSFTNVRRHYKRNVGPHGEEYGRSVYLRYYPPTTTIHGMEEQQLIYEQAENYDDPLRCPVKLFEFYLSKCPESVKCRQDVLYLLPEGTCVPESPLWFSSQSLPSTTMEQMLTRIKTVRDVNDIHLSMSQTSFETNHHHHHHHHQRS